MKKFVLQRVKKIGSKISNGSSTIQTRIQKTKNTFKDQFNEARQKPISKRKSAFLGFSTIMGIFGIWYYPVLPAIAKDVPAPKPTYICYFSSRSW